MADIIFNLVGTNTAGFNHLVFIKDINLRRALYIPLKPEVIVAVRVANVYPVKVVLLNPLSLGRIPRFCAIWARQIRLLSLWSEEKSAPLPSDGQT